MEPFITKKCLTNKNRLEIELSIMKRLHHISTRFICENNFQDLLAEIVEAAVIITNANMGNIQIYDERSSSLQIVAHSGFKKPFLDFFSTVHTGQAACGAAMKLKERVIIEDITQSPIFINTPSLDVMLDAGAWAVQSTPLYSRQGRLVGMLSTHYHTPSRPNDQDLQLLDVLARQSADIIERVQIETRIAHIDRLNLIGEMAASLGHEVRNPMTTVRGYLQLFQKKDEFKAFKSQLDTMVEELDRANLIISEFLSLAKNKVVELKYDNLNNTIYTLYPLLQAEAFRLGHDFQMDLNEIPLINYDDREIRQLIHNLVRNGIEAMKTRGTLKIKTYIEDEKVVLSIQDTGTGIAKDIQESIGIPFRTTKDNGIGIGLSVCYRIAQRHEAELDFVTGSNGTKFFIRFKNKQLA
ncbi:ATP-binding protein [Pelosinus sp. sgz500959]|uniref:ATP-binding protein n=1 Tax=Pelosinus sp. sgz500959 TaxID=3242472 RepID=UPI00366AEBE1